MGITFTGVTFSGGGFQIQGQMPPPTGQQAYTTAGTYTWTAPENVTSVSVVCVGGGASGYTASGYAVGGGGGGLGWKNNISVTPGQTYTVVVGQGGNLSTSANGGDSYFISNVTVAGLGGKYGARSGVGGSYVGDGGGSGGSSDTTGYSTPFSSGAGGAGGYSGNGGNGGKYTTGLYNGQAGQGGGGGGGGGGYLSDNQMGFAGGGVGIFGQGSNGLGGSGSGSSGSAGTAGSGGSLQTYGGGGQAKYVQNGDGGGGAVRIIWGANRAFPSTNTQDMS